MLQRTDQPMTLERAERAQVFAAFIVREYGDRYLPAYEAIEKLVEDLRSRGDARQRADRLLANYTNAGGLKAIR